MIMTILKALVGAFTGGSLDRILDTVEKRLDNEVTKEEVKAEITKTWINAQTQLLVGRTWWFQLFFVVPFGLWVSTAIGIVLSNSLFGTNFPMPALPPPLDEWAGWIISSIFIVDQGKAILGRVGGLIGKGK